MDYPSEKQTTSTTIVVPRGLFALGNGALVDRHDDGETTIFRYEQRIPHATYLMTMVAGDFAEVELLESVVIRIIQKSPWEILRQRHPPLRSARDWASRAACRSYLADTESRNGLTASRKPTVF